MFVGMAGLGLQMKMTTEGRKFMIMVTGLGICKASMKQICPVKTPYQFTVHSHCRLGVCLNCSARPHTTTF